VISGAVGGISGARVRQSDSIVEAFSKNLTRVIANTAGREIVRYHGIAFWWHEARSLANASFKK
jgi:hypothetical protein